MSKKEVNQSGTLLENEHVKELLAILKENSVSPKDLLDVIGYVGAMERQLDAAVSDLLSMRKELSELQESKDHPIRVTLQKAINSLENKINETRERLEAVKADIIDGCKKAVAAFKEKGIAALDSLASFFKIRKGLEAVRDRMNQTIGYDEKAMKKIEAISTEYHEAGKHVKNIGRTALGKETVSQANPMGRLAKLIQAPYRLDKAYSQAVKRQTEKAIGSLEKLGERAASQREAKEAGKTEKKPSILKNLQDFKEQAAQTTKQASLPQRKRQEASL